MLTALAVLVALIGGVCVVAFGGLGLVEAWRALRFDRGGRHHMLGVPSGLAPVSF